MRLFICASRPAFLVNSRLSPLNVLLESQIQYVQQETLQLIPSQSFPSLELLVMKGAHHSLSHVD